MHTLKDLFLALLNATLILVALCLFLGWKMVTAAQSVTASFGEKVQVVAPLRDDVRDMRAELEGLRGDLASIQVDNQVLGTVSAQRISDALDRLDGLETKLQGAQSRISEIAETPDILMDKAIQATTAQVSNALIELKGCVPPV